MEQASWRQAGSSRKASDKHCSVESKRSFLGTRRSLAPSLAEYRIGIGASAVAMALDQSIAVKRMDLESECKHEGRILRSLGQSDVSRSGIDTTFAS